MSGWGTRNLRANSAARLMAQLKASREHDSDSEGEEENSAPRRQAQPPKVVEVLDDDPEDASAIASAGDSKDTKATPVLDPEAVPHLGDSSSLSSPTTPTALSSPSSPATPTATPSKRSGSSRPRDVPRASTTTSASRRKSSRMPDKEGRDKDPRKAVTDDDRHPHRRRSSRQISPAVEGDDSSSASGVLMPSLSKGGAGGIVLGPNHPMYRRSISNADFKSKDSEDTSDDAASTAASESNSARPAEAKPSPSPFTSVAPSAEEVDQADLPALIESIRQQNKSLRDQVRQKDAVIASLQNKLAGLLAQQATAAEGGSKKKKEEQSRFNPETLQRLRHTHRPRMLDRQSEFGHREKLVYEVLTTEQSYVTGLEILCQIYLNPLMDLANNNPNKLSKDEVAQIFGNIESIRILNQNFLSDLEERLDGWWEPHGDRIGDLLAKWAPKFKPYDRFGSHYNESLQKLEELKKSNSLWRKELEELDASVSKLDGLEINAYFIMPVQRLPRYVLLIRDLLKSTPEEHPDHRELQAAAVAMSKVADSLNESIRRAESQVHLFEILERGQGFDRLISAPKQYAAPRYWVRDDSLPALYDVRADRVLLPSASGKKRLELIMFNDILVFSPYVSKKAAPQDYHQPTQILWAMECLPEMLKEWGLDEGEHQARFQSSVLLEGPENQWVIAFENAAKRRAWMETLQTVQNLRPDAEQGEGVREGKYDFKDPNLGTYDGEWLAGFLHGKGTLVIGKISYDGYWDARYKAGFGYVDGKYKETKLVGWKFVHGEIVIVDEHGLWEEGALSDHDWKLLLTGAQVVKKAAGERFIEQGKLNTNLYRVKKGMIRVEKSSTPNGPKQVLVKLGPGTVLGDTSVIPSMKAATADVLADDTVTLEAISIQILFGLFRSNPGLSMRFYRQMARKLATQLRSLHSGKRSQEPQEGEDDLDSEEEEVEKAQSARKEKEEEEKDEKAVEDANSLQAKFHLDPQEQLILSTDCMQKGVLKKVGKLHVFQRTLAFESNVFGSSSKEVFPLEQIDSLSIDSKKGLKLLHAKKKHNFVQLKEAEPLKAVLIPLWQEALKNPSQAARDKAEKKGKKDKKKDKDKLARTASQGLGGSEQGPVTMASEDWNMLIEGAKLVHYRAGDYVIEEGREHLRIYQIAQGACFIRKKVEGGGEITLGRMEAGALFGEMTFLEKGAATASIIADGDCQIYIIEGYFINILFVDHPALAGRFYSYLATILAQRLSDRELQIQRETQEAAAERRRRRAEAKKARAAEPQDKPSS